jgi:hypothetical protein
MARDGCSCAMSHPQLTQSCAALPASVARHRMPHAEPDAQSISGRHSSPTVARFSLAGLWVWASVGVCAISCSIRRASPSP